jgi:hypothetical protein
MVRAGLGQSAPEGMITREASQPWAYAALDQVTNNIRVIVGLDRIQYATRKSGDELLCGSSIEIRINAIDRQDRLLALQHGCNACELGQGAGFCRIPFCLHCQASV